MKISKIELGETEVSKIFTGPGRPASEETLNQRLASENIMAGYKVGVMVKVLPPHKNQEKVGKITSMHGMIGAADVTFSAPQHDSIWTETIWLTSLALLDT